MPNLRGRPTIYHFNPTFDQFYGQTHDHGVSDDKRFIVGFNPTLFVEDRKNRKEKIGFSETYLKNKKKDLKNAQRGRKRQATEGRVLNEPRHERVLRWDVDPQATIKCELHCSHLNFQVPHRHLRRSGRLRVIRHRTLG